MGWDREILDKLGSHGEECYIGEDVFFAHPELVHLGSRVRIDGRCWITTGLVTGDNIQVMSGAKLIGGKEHTVTLGRWSFIGYDSHLYCASEDYSGKHGPVNEFWGSNKIFRGDIEIGNFAGIASNVTLFPGTTIPEGTCIGHGSMVRPKRVMKKWSVYYGQPRIRLMGHRNKETILECAHDPGFLK